ncbi:hypothetical protein [Halorubrum kocurii]|uniref:Uncharacterized protein n=1 Tax=Halorubrum kocurii JCM 14978 TaxID=1230456 RepID=M0P8R7_9EURY|nr:hypothetical protein [Halorubrum kocurii]EMA66253.1 hypothetical protein C468_04569 [Halorubrum kocurii JCM 14978]
MQRTRRDLLATGAATLTAAGSVGVAGCLDFAAGDGPQGPEGVPETLTCEDDAFVRLTPPFDEPVEGTVVDAAGTRFELATEGNAETYGQSMRLVFRNTGDEPGRVLGKHAYSLQRETGEGWLEVRGSSSGETVELPRTEETLDPSGAYIWSIDLEEAVIASAVPDRDLAVCPPLGAGTHRFVYWGIVDGPPLGAEFELVG